jgi:hypothetical protein
MQKLSLLLGALMLAAPAALGSPAVPIMDDLPAPDIIPGLIGPTTARCNGTAPGTTQCSSGTHLMLVTPASGVSHSFSGVNFAGYTGTVESKLSWTNGLQSGERTFRCNVTNGVIQCMPGFGAFPPQGADIVTHTCKSYTKGTTTLGGSGNWACNVTFTGATLPAV